MKIKNLLMAACVCFTALMASCSDDTVEVESISLSATSFDLVIGEEVRLEAVINPDNSTVRKVEWSSLDETIATVDGNGLVKAVAEGMTNIKATAGETSSLCRIIVYPVGAVISVHLNKLELDLYIGEEEQLFASLTPEVIADPIVTWESSDETVAFVGTDGMVKAVSAGTASISAMAGEKTAVCVVTVLPNIYVAGWEMSPSGKSAAKYWLNGEAVDLTDGTNEAEALSLFVREGDIYIAGWEVSPSGKSVAKYWLNGTETILSDGTNDAYARSVFVSGSDVYVAGYEMDASGGSTAKYWKNGSETILGVAGDGAAANAVFVSGGDVYVAGYGDNSQVRYPKYWRNGVETLLAAEDGGEASSLFVSGEDVSIAGKYFVGEYISMAAVWNGEGEFTALTGGTRNAGCNSVFISDAEVYTAGYEDNFAGISAARSWIGERGLNLTDGTVNADARSVYVFENTAYVAGVENGVATFWIGGYRVRLGDAANQTGANSIFVTGE